MSVPDVLFVCVHNAGRSRMAEALFNARAEGRFTAASAGTQPADRPHPEVVTALSEIGIDLAAKPGTLLTPELADQAGRVISMGCSVEEACPATTTPTTDWALSDPKGQPMEEVRAIRDDIAERVAGLIADLERAAGRPSPFARRTRLVRERAEDELAPAATRSVNARGRVRDEPPDAYRTAFERDRDRILYSKAFRRLKHKTQVFLNPEGDHFVTRLSHTLQVTQVARSLAAALGLNETLAEAIALAHDVGHTPFGHTGEEALSPYVDGGWHHAAQGVRLYEVLEDANLTWEVRDGIRAHTWMIEPPPATPEGLCVRFADRIAYLSHDALDAIRAGVLAPEELPEPVRDHLGQPGRQWIGGMIDAVVETSFERGEIAMRPDILACMHELRDFMFERVYQAGDNARKKSGAVRVIRELVDYHLEHPDELPSSYRDTDADLVTQVIDYVAGMTDRYALARHDRLFRPTLP